MIAAKAGCPVAGDRRDDATRYSTDNIVVGVRDKKVTRGIKRDARRPI